MNTLRLLLGDQLNSNHSWFSKVDENVVYCLFEMRQETDYVTHHIQKVVGFFAAMKFYNNGYVDIFAALYMALIFTIFASFSTEFTLKVNEDFLRKGFGIFTILSGLYIFFKKN